MKIKLFSFIILAIAISSCNENKIYSELNKDFADNRWQKSEVKDFEFSIDQEARNYNVAINFAYLSDFQLNPVPMTITIIHPDETEEIKQINIVVKDKDGKETGVCGGDYCDIKQTVLENVALKKGVYKVLIRQNFNGEYLPNVNGVGIDVISQMD